MRRLPAWFHRGLALARLAAAVPEYSLASRDARDGSGADHVRHGAGALVPEERTAAARSVAEETRLRHRGTRSTGRVAGSRRSRFGIGWLNLGRGLAFNFWDEADGQEGDGQEGW
jgi:hypothetical protein